MPANNRSNLPPESSFGWQLLQRTKELAETVKRVQTEGTTSQNCMLEIEKELLSVKQELDRPEQSP